MSRQLLQQEYYNSNVQEYAPQTYKITMDFASQLKVGHIIQSSMKDTVKNLVLCMAVCRDPRQSPLLKFQPINPLWVPLRHMVLFETNVTVNTSSSASAPSPKPGTNKFTSLQSQISNKSGDENSSKAKNEHEKVESKLSNEQNKDVEKLKMDDAKEIVYYSLVSKPNRQQPPDAVSVKSDCNAATFTDNSDKTNKTITEEVKIVSDNHKPEPIIAIKPTISEKPAAKVLTNQSSVEKPTPAQKPSFNVLPNSLAVDQKNCNSDLNNYNAKKETLNTDIKFTIAEGVNGCAKHKIYDIDRAFAHELLKNAETGCFLFRKSVKKPGGLTLSVASSSPRQLHNFFIEIEDSKYKIGNYGFDSLDQIISYYSKNSIVENESDSAVKLTKQFSIC
ncbi:hypothetical protein HELRODRAFT_177849 [Helobdella robusta]|uniref:SH2 domain-containing protein n=1 Tax=Helobdella robusta TaxID=6412 RepID=T1FCD2_HELRO|nr:hypothetical protein HELRODRAFT_177849 [Helobdella robusta]ESN97786.1 hypothetical protein HELRODRAFT_177849 [Helobdella robusta]